MNKIIYLDNAATTLVNPDVLQSYEKVCRDYFANPSSIHALGQTTHRLLEKSRDQIKDILGVKDHDVIFTSGATEANNLAIKGYALKYQNRGKHIILSNVEHPSVYETVNQLVQCFGFESTELPVNSQGIIELEDLKKALRKDTILVSIMAVNNQTGAINPINEIALILRNYPLCAFHVDVTQGLGKIKIDYDLIDMFSFSGHKIHALHSSGALVKRKKIELLPLLSGGGQENNLRSGTNDLPLAVSLAKAMRMTFENFEKTYAKAQELHGYLITYLKEHSDLYHLNSYSSNPFIVNFSTLTKKASVVVEALSNAGIMVSSTSACHSHNEPINLTVFNMSEDEKLAHNTIRISFDESNTLDEVKFFIKTLEEIIGSIK